MTLLFLIVVPATLNIFNFEYNNGGPGIYFWANIMTQGTYNTLFPDYWRANYAFLFYFLGAWIKDNMKKKCHKGKAGVIILLNTIIYGTIIFGRNIYRTVITTDPILGWANIFTVINVFTMFNLIMQLDFSKMPVRLKNIFRKVSEYSFSMYLLSFIADALLYKWLQQCGVSVLDRVWFIPLMICGVCMSSFVMAAPVEILGRKIYRKIEKDFVKKGEKDGREKNH